MASLHLVIVIFLAGVFWDRCSVVAEDMLPTVVPGRNTSQPSSSPRPSSSLAPSLTPSLSRPFSVSPGPSISQLPTLAAVPSITPSGQPSRSFSPSISFMPSDSLSPSVAPTTSMPTISEKPSSRPSTTPSASPSLFPSAPPSKSFSPSLSTMPSQFPSSNPSTVPTESPAPSPSPSTMPSVSPSITLVPSVSPSLSFAPSESIAPSDFPSSYPTAIPSDLPSSTPTTSEPSETPSDLPSKVPSLAPTGIPSSSPSSSPTVTMMNITTEGPLVQTLRYLRNLTSFERRLWEDLVTDHVWTYWNDLYVGSVAVTKVETVFDAQLLFANNRTSLFYRQNITFGVEREDEQDNLEVDLFLRPFQLDAQSYLTELERMVDAQRSIVLERVEISPLDPEDDDVVPIASMEPSASPSEDGGMSGGAIAAAVVVPILAVLAILAAVLYWKRDYFFKKDGGADAVDQPGREPVDTDAEAQTHPSPLPPSTYEPQDVHLFPVSAGGSPASSGSDNGQLQHFHEFPQHPSTPEHRRVQSAGVYTPPASVGHRRANTSADVSPRYRRYNSTGGDPTEGGPLRPRLSSTGSYDERRFPPAANLVAFDPHTGMIVDPSTGTLTTVLSTEAATSSQVAQPGYMPEGTSSSGSEEHHHMMEPSMTAFNLQIQDLDDLEQLDDLAGELTAFGSGG